MNHILDELKRRKTANELHADEPFIASNYDLKPVTPAQLADAESRLGFALPELLRRIYGEVSNGGFGYSYGLLGLTGGMLNEDRHDAVTQYLSYRRPDPDDGFWSWPSGLLPIGHLGCAMYHCVRCDDPAAPIVWFEPNPHEDGKAWDDAFFAFAPSLPAYLEAWLDGKDLFEEFMGDA